MLPLVIFVSLALGPSAALAEVVRANPDEARRLVLDYATCIVKRHHDKAADALIANADDNTIKRDFGRLIDGACLRSDVDRIGFDADTFRYAMAEALVVAEFAGNGPSDFSDRPLLAHLPIPEQSELDTTLAHVKTAKAREDTQNGFEKAKVMGALSRYGECVVRRDPNDSRLWVLTPPASPDEDGRIDALRPFFGACLKDGKVAFSKATLRGAVALNYYRLAHAPRQPIAKN